MISTVKREIAIEKELRSKIEWACTFSNCVPMCMSQDKWSGLIYNAKANYNRFDTMLKNIDEEYRTTHINMAKYFNAMFTEARLMESSVEQQNQVALYLFNNINKNNEILKFYLTFPKISSIINIGNDNSTNVVLPK